MKMKRIICNVLLASMIVSASPMYAFGDFFKGLFKDLKETTQNYVQEKRDATIKKEVGKAAKEADKEASNWFLKADPIERLMFGSAIVLAVIFGLTLWSKRQKKKGKEFSILGTLLGFGKFAEDTKHGKKKQEEAHKGMKAEAKKATAKSDTKEENQSTTGKAWNWFTDLFREDNKKKQEAKNGQPDTSHDAEFAAGLAAGEE